MDQLYTVFLVFLTVNLVTSTEITCEDSSTAQSCELRLNSNNTRCETDEAFHRICPCTCDEYRTRTTTPTPVVESPDENPDSNRDCQADIENDCELRLRLDPSICGFENIMQFCPCTCRERVENPEVQEQEDPESVDHHDNDENQNVVNPNLCADVPDSKMEYDCQFRIAQNPKLCNDASYRGMCRCTCSRFGNRATLEENAVDSLLTPDEVLPIIPEETAEDPERCPDYRDSDRGRGCFMRVANLRGQVCPDNYREACPCTCRALDEGELCPDSPWTAIAGVCQMREANGGCSDPKVREECPCTCAFVLVGPTPIVDTNPEDEDTQIDQSHPGCIDTASERSCRYYVTNNMCESQYQYCRRSCNMCSHELIPDGEEPVVNLMPDVDESEEVERPQEICEDKAPSEVCNNYKETGRCATRWVFCKKTCDACEINPEEEILSVETESESEIELENEEEEEEEEEEMLEEDDDLGVDEGLDDEDEEQQPCTDSISTALCENYVLTNQCENWWRYCRQTCNVCEENPYLEIPEMPLVAPDGSTPNLNGGDRCPQCQLYENVGHCNTVDQVVKDYCQRHCDLCFPEEEEEEEEQELEEEEEEEEEEILLEEEEEQEQEEEEEEEEGQSEEIFSEEEETEEQSDNDEDEGVIIDDEEQLNEGVLLPEPCRNARDNHVNCPEWYRTDQCEINPTVREHCSWTCNQCDQLIQLINQDQEEEELEQEEEIELEEEEEEQEENEQQSELENDEQHEDPKIDSGNDESEETELQGEEEEDGGEAIELETGDSPVVPAVQECEELDWCPDFQHLCEDESNAENMRENCPKTCGHC